MLRPRSGRSWCRMMLGVSVGLSLGPTVAWSADRDDGVIEGETIYRRDCAACHGADLKGESGWQAIPNDGRAKAPAHDETGHTWMHSEAELFRLIKFGAGATVAPGAVSTMPTYAGRLRDEDIRAVLAFIASRWPPGYRAFQMMLDPNVDPARLPAGDWRLPEVCQPPAAAQPPTAPP